METILSALSGAFGDHNAAKSLDILQGRPAYAPRSASDIRRVLEVALSESCTCTYCSFGKYGSSLCNSHHNDRDLFSHGRRRPLFREYEDDGWPFNALFLARSTVKYFTRSVDYFDPTQETAKDTVRIMFRDTEFMDALNKDDCKKNVDEGLMLELVRNLVRVFFFDEMKIDEFRWDSGYSTVVEKDGVRTLTLHPTAYDKRVPLPKNIQRIGAILHQLTCAYLMMHSCKDCIWASEDNLNKVGRGRAWQFIAQAIEETAPELLCLEQIDLRRQASLLADVQAGLDHPSRHDLKMYGFEHLLAPDDEKPN